VYQATPLPEIKKNKVQLVGLGTSNKLTKDNQLPDNASFVIILNACQGESSISPF
jgi:hypothetical protein